MVLCRAIVNGPVGTIVVIFLGGGNLAQAAKSRLVEAVDLVENIGIVQLDISEADEAIGVLLDKFAGFGKSIWSDEQDAQPVGGIQFHQQPVEHAGLSPEMLMHVDEFRLGRLGQAGQ